MAASKINSNLKKWLYQIGRIIMNAILCPSSNINVDKT